ncbi:MAG: L,D-transpeptidase [Syntrophobacter sp.]
MWIVTGPFMLRYSSTNGGVSLLNAHYFQYCTGLENMKHDLIRWLLLWIIWTIPFCFSQIAAAASSSAPIDGGLYAELLRFHTDRKIVEVDGVPCIKVFLPKGQSISYFCRFVKHFDDNFHFYRQQIALINRLEPMAIIEGGDSLSTDVKFIYVPLNFSIRPKILPERIATASRLPKFILVDLGQQCLGLYAYGKLIHQFPISSGRNGTPAKKFVILSKETDHYSTKYDNAWMPYSMRLFGNYFLHAGILPSYAASHGCVRVIYENMVFVYNWAEVGTPGEVINQTPLKPKDPVPVKEEADNEEEPDIKTLFY